MVLGYIIDALSYSMLVFLVAVGLGLILGLMDVINLSHGSIFMIGAYVAISSYRSTSSVLLAAAIAAGVTLALGLVIEKGLLKPFYGRGHLDQVLLTLGLVYIIADLCLWIWGPHVQGITLNGVLGSTVSLFGQEYPVYRLVIIGVGLAIAGGLVYVERETMYGATVRAGVADRETLSALGVNVERVTLIGFGIGALLAGFAGGLAAPVLGAYPGLDTAILLSSLIVVVVGGLGSLIGPFLGSLLVGGMQTVGEVFVPQYASFTVYALMVVVLLVRPQGLVGRPIL